MKINHVLRIIRAYMSIYAEYTTACHDHDSSSCKVLVLGRHGSASLCRDGQENKMAATYMY